MLLNPNQSIRQCSHIAYFTGVCICAGNYYSLRSQHEKAVLYFQRALKLNPNYLSAWTLMGHEYMELKQTSAAIQAYRQAIGLHVVTVFCPIHSCYLYQ